MRKTSEINIELVLKLREKGVSVKAIAARFAVPANEISKVTAEFEDDFKPNYEAVKVVRMLQKLNATAPTKECAMAVQSTIDSLKTYQAVNRATKFNRILTAIGDGAQCLSEISEEVHLSKEETRQLLDELVKREKIEPFSRGGVLNRGRKTKMFYGLK